MHRRRSQGDGEERGSKKSKKSEMEFTVERLEGRRMARDGQMEYFVKWENFPDTENTWEPKQNLPSELINEYNTTYAPAALQRWQSGYTVATSGLDIEVDFRMNMETGGSYMIDSGILCKSGRFIEDDEKKSHMDNYYHCKYLHAGKEYKCILKFPSPFIEVNYYGVDEDNGAVGILGETEKEKIRKKNNVLKLPGDPLERYREEGRIASALLDSKEHIKHRNPHAPRMQYTPDTVTNTTLNTIERQMENMRKHPGYSRIYPIRYVDFNECFAIGKQCDGLVRSLINSESTPFRLKTEENNAFGKIPHVWLSLAYQIGQGILFLRNAHGMSHVNINQYNIMYEEQKEPHGFAFYLYGFLDCYKLSDDPGDLGLYNFALFLVDILTKHTDVDFIYRQKQSTDRLAKWQIDYSKVSVGDRIQVQRSDDDIDNAFILAKGKRDILSVIFDENKEEVVELDLSKRSSSCYLASSMDCHWISEDADTVMPHLQQILEFLENILNSTGAKRYEFFCNFLIEVEKYLIPAEDEVDFKKIEELF
jgi:hypothetical protein